MDSGTAASYELCRKLHARHGRTYYLATRLLPSYQRNAVSGLYGFARYVDDIVDVHLSLAPARERIERVRAMLHDGFKNGHTEHPVLAATVDTASNFGIPAQLFDDFLDAMAMDLDTATYPTWDALRSYMWGSAAVIGIQMVRIIGSVGPHEDADPYAAKLGEAFQLTNFCRDFEEDRARGRIYLPLEDFTAAEISTDATDVRRVIERNVERARKLYAEARPGIALLSPAGRDCVRVAFELYQAILDEIEGNGFDITTRAVVGVGRRARTALPAIPRALLARSTPRLTG